MKKLMFILSVFCLSACGVYIHRGDGAYTFIGPGSYRLGKRCSPYAQWSMWNPNYDYSRMEKESTGNPGKSK